MAENDEECGGYPNEIFCRGEDAYYKCGVCHLVMRDPILIPSCQHGFCQTCFTKEQDELDEENFKCPVDGETIPQNKPYMDSEKQRRIQGFMTKCGNNELGCQWYNDLKYFEEHQEECKYRVREDDPAEILKRVKECEKKQKDIVHLQTSLEEMKRRFDEKEAEVNVLKESIPDLQKKLEVQEESNEKMKCHFEKELHALQSKFAGLQADVSKEAKNK